MKKSPLIIALLLFTMLLMSYRSEAQDRRERMTLAGQVVMALITEGNDTLLIADLEDVQVTSPRKFQNSEDYRRYMKYRRYAAIVYPYAVEAVRTYRQIEENTGGIKKRKRRKYIRNKKKELKEEFKGPLSKLTKTQGFLLIKMLEKELDVVMYDLIQDTRGGLNAFTWNLLGNLNGYSLKEGYKRGKDPILDMVLDDYDISH